MIPVIIAGATHRMDPPTGMPECAALHVIRDGDTFISAWEPTPAELAILNRGGLVTLFVQGGQPPVMLGAKDRDA